MPTKVEKDSVSGRLTTGHEWDGLKELNTPLPKWWLYVFLACVVFAAGQMLLYPSVPFFTGYFPGLLGYSQRVEVDRAVQAVAQQRAETVNRIGALSFEQIRADPPLLNAALSIGRITFAENCQPCHGTEGTGRPGYPALGDDVWIWGGSLAAIQQTITHGVRSEDKDTRTSAMPAFGALGSLKPAEMEAVADYVQGLFGLPPGKNAAEGQKLFVDNCASCHGDKGQGNQELGGPPLASRVHLYGGDRAAILAQINQPKHGVMPAWNARLSAPIIKSLTLYVHSLGGGQ